MNSGGWVPESRFGVWFLGTQTWQRHVLTPGLEVISQLLREGQPKFSSILDAGCGFGGAFGMLERRFRPQEIIGIDINPVVLKAAQKTASQCFCKIKIRQGEVTKLDLMDASFDAVFCHQTLHHVIDQKLALSEFHRVLKPGGMLLLTESCRCFIRSWPIQLLFRHAMEVQRSAKEYCELVQSAGFEIRPENIATLSPWWTRSDFGICKRLGWEVAPPPEPSLVQVVARRHLKN